MKNSVNKMASSINDDAFENNNYHDQNNPPNIDNIACCEDTENIKDSGDQNNSVKIDLTISSDTTTVCVNEGSCEVSEIEIIKTINDTAQTVMSIANKQMLKERIKSSDVIQVSVTFEDFQLDRGLQMALYEMGWEWPSPIQAASIPLILQGESLIARAKNGTGKTGAYAVAIINKLQVNDTVQCLVLVPTRELALQTSNECINLSKYMQGINIMVSTGGTDVTDDIYRLNNKAQPVQFFVATPGRALDLIGNNQIKTNDINFFVLDEADKLMSNDFKTIILEILKLLKRDKQILLFSATYPESLKSFIDQNMPNSKKINLMNELTLKGVTQYYAFLKEEQKLSCLKILLKNLDVHQAIIFCSTMMRVELLAKSIINMGYSCYYTHAKMDQRARNQVFVDFRAGHVRNLVCTDVMTRGIDIPRVNVVFNFDFPKHTETYLHRIGRCGRFGHLGIAINLITTRDIKSFFEIEQHLNYKITAIPRNIDKRLYVASYQLESFYDEKFIENLRSVATNV